MADEIKEALRALGLADVIDLDDAAFTSIAAEAERLGRMMGGVIDPNASPDQQAKAVTEALSGGTLMNALLRIQASVPDASTKSAIASLVGNSESARVA